MPHSQRHLQSAEILFVCRFGEFSAIDHTDRYRTLNFKPSVSEKSLSRIENVVDDYRSSSCYLICDTLILRTIYCSQVSPSFDQIVSLLRGRGVNTKFLWSCCGFRIRRSEQFRWFSSHDPTCATGRSFEAARHGAGVEMMSCQDVCKLQDGLLAFSSRVSEEVKGLLQLRSCKVLIFTARTMDLRLSLEHYPCIDLQEAETWSGLWTPPHS